MLLTRFFEDDRIQVHQPRRNLQIKLNRPVAGKTTLSPTSTPLANSTARPACWSGRRLRAATRKNPTGRCLWIPAGLLLVDDRHCGSRPSRIRPETAGRVQYLRTIITEEQRQEFGHLVENTFAGSRRKISAAQRHPFSQNPCSSCPDVGFVLETRDGRRQPGAASRPGSRAPIWLDELND